LGFRHSEDEHSENEEDEEIDEKNFQKFLPPYLDRMDIKVFKMYYDWKIEKIYIRDRSLEDNKILLLHYGFFFYHNWEYLSNIDLHKFAIIYGININQSKENIITDIIDNQKKIIFKIQKTKFFNFVHDKFDYLQELITNQLDLEPIYIYKDNIPKLILASTKPITPFSHTTREVINDNSSIANDALEP